MNYTQAAQILGITQPALTQQIKKLERAIGAPLFGQMGKKLYLTEAGKEMQTAAVKLLGTINSVVDDIQEFTEADKGTINFGVLQTLDLDIFRQFLVRFKQKFPDINLNVISCDRKELWRRLDNNLVDIAIMYLPDNTKKDEISLQHQYDHVNIYKEKLIVLTHKKTVKSGEAYPASRFAKRKWVAYPNEFYLTQLLRTYLGRNEKMQISLSFSKAPYLVKTAQETNLDTFVTKSYYLTHKSQITLTPVFLKDERDFELALVYRKGKLDIPRIENLLKEWHKFLDIKDYSSRLEEN